jgi:hypothetical protein
VDEIRKMMDPDGPLPMLVFFINNMLKIKGFLMLYLKSFDGEIVNDKSETCDRLKEMIGTRIIESRGVRGGDSARRCEAMLHKS